MQHPAVPALADPLFQPLTASEAAFPHPAWQRARAVALAAVSAGGVAVLTGPPGSGKSLLLKDLARALRHDDQPVHLIERADALEGAPDSAILLVDEADAVSSSALASLCAGPRSILLAALPGFAARLAGLSRPVQQIELDRLSPQDVARYVAFRLAASARPRDLLEPDAVLALARHSGGLLRLVNTLGSASVFLAGLDAAAQVAVRHVEEAASMRGELDGPETPAAPLLTDEPAPPMPSYRGAELRRRAAVGGMVAAAGVLFALPWLTGGRRAQRLGAEAVAGAQTATAASPVAVTDTHGARQAASPMPAKPAPDQPPEFNFDPVDVADSSPEQGAAGSPAPQPVPSRPGLQTAPPPRSGPQRQLGSAPSAQAPADRHAVLAADALVRFHGPIFNETMGQGGHVTLVIRKQAPGGAITARFDASQGLVGTGVLAGSEAGGRIIASGQLLMGRNPFLCDLSGTLNGDTLTGSASFVHAPGGMVYHSRFSLVRA